MVPKRDIQVGGECTLRAATNADLPVVWDLISSVLLSYGITGKRQTTDRDLADLEVNYWNAKGAFFVLLNGEAVIEPFAPINTLRFFNSRAGLPEAKESRLSSLML